MVKSISLIISLASLLLASPALAESPQLISGSVATVHSWQNCYQGGKRGFRQLITLSGRVATSDSVERVVVGQADFIRRSGNVWTFSKTKRQECLTDVRPGGYRVSEDFVKGTALTGQDSDVKKVPHTLREIKWLRR